MGKEDMGIMDAGILVWLAVCFIVLALVLLIRFVKGPSAADRAVAADSIEILTDMALILFALHTGRSIYLDIALVTAVLGFVGTVIIARYLEGKL